MKGITWNKNMKSYAVIGKVCNPNYVAVAGAGHTIFERLVSSTSINENKSSDYILSYKCSLGREMYLDATFMYEHCSACYHPCIL